MHKRLVTYINPEKRALPGQTGKTLDLILFYQGTHLRSHAVYHLANFTEIRDWKKVASIDVEAITENIDHIKDIGCPYFSGNARRPPCYRDSIYCIKWKQCTPFAAPIENSYLDCCSKVIEAGFSIPMLAAFQNIQGNKNFWAMGQHKIVALCTLIKNNYTLKTCYRPKQGANVTWKEIRDHLIGKIHFESVGRICWITDEIWGLVLKNDKRNQSQRKERRTRNRRGLKW